MSQGWKYPASQVTRLRLEGTPSHEDLEDNGWTSASYPWSGAGGRVGELWTPAEGWADRLLAGGRVAKADGSTMTRWYWRYREDD